MARVARVRSCTGVYHVLVRGRLDIFRDDEDVEIYADILRKLQEEGKCVVYFYGINKNHVHLIVEERENAIGPVMACINRRYYYYYAVKYGVTGNLYVDRFQSMPIETVGYFSTVVDSLKEGSFIFSHYENISPETLTREEHQAGLGVLTYVDKSGRKTNAEVLEYIRNTHGYTSKEDYASKCIEEKRVIVRDTRKFGASHKQMITFFGRFEYLLKERKCDLKSKEPSAR